MPDAKTVTVKMQDGREFVMAAPAVAHVDPALCVNCGKCRDICPTEAIEELQRDICRLCPDCMEGPLQFPEESQAYAPLHACSLACPLGTVPEGYVRLISEGRFQQAYDLVRDLNPLPVICSMICHHPCEDECKRGLLIDKPIAIRALKRFVLGKAEAPPLKFNTRFDRKIAIIGAGPAGITAAADLAKKGYRVKIFEGGPEPGGMMRKGIPDFRLDKDEMRKEIQRLLDAGIEIEYNRMIGKDPTIEDLLNDKYEAVLIAVGACKGFKLPILGHNAEKVYDAVSFMLRANNRVTVDIGKKAVVIGGGSVAMDTARMLRRMGVEDVTCAFIEACKCEKKGDVLAPAPKSEIQEARDEGVKILDRVTPLRIVAEWMTVKGVEFQKVQSLSTDPKGGICCKGRKGSEFVVNCDTVIFATGQKTDVKAMGEASHLELTEKGTIKFDDRTLVTSNPRVFVAGDATAARGSVVDAMASGRKAALAIDNMMQGRELVSRVHAKPPRLAPMEEKIYPAVFLEKLEPQKVPMNRFRDNFDLVEGVFDDRTAMIEARRCMKCGYSGVDADRCLGCGACSKVCPEDAITMVSK